MFQKVLLQPAYILHARSYRDSSLLLEALTLEQGRISLVAKGARGARSRYKGLLQPFIPLLISWQGRTELMTLTAAEPRSASHNFMGKTLLCGFYINELLIRLFHRFDPHPRLFESYQQTLNDLPTDQLRALRLFEKNLLAELGYALQFSREAKTGDPILADRIYYFEPLQGFLYSGNPILNRESVFRGESLLAIHQNQFNQADHLQDAKRLFRLALQHLLNGKSIRSRELFFYTPVLDSL